MAAVEKAIRAQSLSLREHKFVLSKMLHQEHVKLAHKVAPRACACSHVLHPPPPPRLASSLRPSFPHRTPVTALLLTLCEA